MLKDSTIYTKNNMKGLVGGPLLVGGLGPGPPGLPLNPALHIAITKQNKLWCESTTNPAPCCETHYILSR